MDPSFMAEPGLVPGESPRSYALRVARLKASETARKHRSGVVIGADTIVVVGDRILGKPSSGSDARVMLRSLSRRWHEVITGICIIDCRSGRSRSTCEYSRVHFRRITEAEIEWYVGTGEYRDKAGAYGIQGYASLFVDRIEGCYFNIVGFPVAAFQRLCRKLDIDLTRHLSPR